MPERRKSDSVSAFTKPLLTARSDYPRAEALGLASRVEDVFAGQADFAQMVKIYGDYGQHDATGRYSPAPMIETIVKIRDGRPDPKHISTSYVERQNLTIRMAIRRFTRLTNAFSKKLDNHKAACALHFAYYNFCRIHKSLRVTPAMEAGITDHIWSLRELLQ